MKKIPFALHDGYYLPEQINTVLTKAVNRGMTTGNNKGDYVYNLPCAFDIETTSFYTDENGNNYTYVDYMEQVKRNPDFIAEKRAIMYVWQFGINGYVVIGRTWEQFLIMLDEISKFLALDEKTRLIIYVHNLAYEFQFMRKWFEWDKVFAIDTRKPIYAIAQGIEFRCSYLLSGYSLAKLSEQLLKYKVRKMVGDLDYSLLRHSKTELTQRELMYCMNDVLVVMAYIQEKIEDNGGMITNLPVTKTGFVRSACRNKCLYKKGKNGKTYNGTYKKLMEELTITADELKQLQRAFQGGFTHANAYYVRQECEDVTSYDFTSSYPYVMCSSYFPMGKAVLVDCKTISERQFVYYLQNFCCLFDVIFEGLKPKVPYENPISASRCFVRENVTINNGRIVTADKIATTITELDFLVYKDFYTWESCTVNNLRIYKRGYLPKPFIETILNFYGDKTTLKGVEGKEIEYLKAKENVNSCYGMAVTSPIRPNYNYNGDDWTVEENEIVGAIIKYNESRQRFLFYPWGVWVTAHARYNLFTGIYNCGTDYIYSDTDSIKIFNAEKHKPYFDKYNEMATDKLKKMCEHYGIDFERTRPKTIQGVSKPLGVWDFDGHYKKFKTLGAKRYMVQYDNDEITLTVSGLNKKVCIPYLLEQYGKEGIFTMFDDNLYIPPDFTGKNIHTYIDEEKQGVLVDYKGVACEYEELSAVHLAPCDYALSLADAFVLFLRGVRYE